MSNKAKEPIKIRFKKLTNGNKSIYFDIYKDGHREYEFLKLYLIPEHSPIDKMQNKETMRTAQTLKAQRVIDLNSSEHFLQNNRQKSKANFIDYCISLAEKKKEVSGNERGTFLVYNSLIYHLQEYKGFKTIFKQAIQDDFIKGFIEYLQTAENKRTGGTISPNTQRTYLKTLKAIFNTAIEDKIIISNPIGKKQIPEKQDTEIAFLTADEVKKLETTECTHPEVKRAFLFSCFTGLRFSDIKRLKWEDFQIINDELFLTYRQTKTAKQEYLPISAKAKSFLPTRQESASNADLVFNIPNNGYTNIFLKVWTAQARIDKKITFHVARHTHATLLLSKGVSIETISEVLGHSNIAVTQIYAKVMNTATRKAVDSLNEL